MVKPAPYSHDRADSRAKAALRELPQLSTAFEPSTPSQSHLSHACRGVLIVQTTLFSSPFPLSIPPPPLPRSLTPSFRRAFSLCTAQGTLEPSSKMINSFDVWAQASNVLENSRLDELTGTVIAIEAAHYLSNRIFNDPQWREPLLPALGGVPFAMKRLVEGDLRKFKEHNITPIFVFGGLDVGKKDNTVFEASKKASSTCEAAWELYNQHQAQNAVDTFGNSCTQPMAYRALIGAADGEVAAIRPGDLFRYLQSILRQAGVRFQVAPYSAWAQVSWTLEAFGVHD